MSDDESRESGEEDQLPARKISRVETKTPRKVEEANSRETVNAVTATNSGGGGGNENNNNISGQQIKNGKSVIKPSSMHRTVDRVKVRIRQMDPDLYCVLLLAQMKNGKLQVASNYPDVGSQFITSELALRFANCIKDNRVFEADAAAAASGTVDGKSELFDKVSTQFALQLVEKNRQQLKFAQRKLDDSLVLLKQSLDR